MKLLKVPQTEGQSILKIILGESHMAWWMVSFADILPQSLQGDGHVSHCIDGGMVKHPDGGSLKKGTYEMVFLMWWWWWVLLK